MTSPSQSTASRSSSSLRFEHVETAPPDAILGLTDAFNADSNPDKMNLSVGVYKDATGLTPVLNCVKEAERRLVADEPSKGYLAIDGLPDYRDHVRDLIFGDTVAADRVAVVQSPGGTGALRIAADFLAANVPGIGLWGPNPTWANHKAVFAAAGLPMQTYRYLAADKTSLDFDAMVEDLRTQTKPGDAVLLHACCHNPTGVDPTPEQWSEIASAVVARRLIPVIDFAYQGFGDGLVEDAGGLRAILDAVPEAIVCNSFSKNFGLYSERVGAISLVAENAENAVAAASQMKRIVRCNYSNPPRHGAAVVATVLGDKQLTQQWHDELAAMRDRIGRLRDAFVTTMKATGVDRDFSFLKQQKGMFSFSGLTPMQVDELKSKHSIYIVGSGRINVAGMVEDRMESLCAAIGDVIA